jgi:hypothetical protein
MASMRPRPAYDSGLHYARVGLTPNWAALWLSGRYDEFRRGYDAGCSERPRSAPAPVPDRAGR